METDALLRRVEHTAIALCGVTAIGVLIVTQGRHAAALAVVAGGVLTAVSYWSIKAGISNLLTPSAPKEDEPTRVSRWRIALQLVGRYALLALLAYVMIVRLRLHPVWLLVGASSIVAAVTVEAVRVFVKKS
ncbi:MAG: ATP synthase subunit I [Acidobacteria bacterium]|nr:ATP synthase subunit I [Acidobacteriota bacterium]MCA1650197.1 ATP synthase subunit I [Acidobacteriota bacterium]